MQTDEWQLLPLLDRTEIGTSGPDGRISVRGNEFAGCILDGPHWTLLSGAYRLTVACRVREPRFRSLPVLGIEVLADNRQQLAWRDFTIAELAGTSPTIDFIVPPELGQGDGAGAIFAFKLFHSMNANIEIEAIGLRRIAEDCADHVLPRWRFLPGYADPTRLASWDDDGSVVVPRRAPPGRFLNLVQPPLPAGRYRLHFRCRWRRLRSVRRPVLRVAVAVGNVSQQGYFYPAAVTAGSSHLDFDVPAAWGVEAGAAGAVEIGFDHFGNAALAVGAIELVLLESLSAALPVAEVSTQYLTLRLGSVPGRRWPFPLPLRKRLLAEPLALQLSGRPTAIEIEPEHGHEADRAVEAKLVARRGGRWARRPTTSLAGNGNSEAADRELRVCTRDHTDLALARADLRTIGIRKNAIIVGNCHAALIHKGFREIPLLQKYFVTKHQDILLPSRFYEQAKRDLAGCELLILQDISNWKVHPLREWVNDRCEILSFPCVRFASLWPFDQRNGIGDAAAFAVPNSPFPYLDGLLGRLRTEIVDPDMRFSLYGSLDVAGVPNFMGLHNFEIRRLLAMDRKFSCNIGQFIIDRFRTEQIFYTTDHPNGQIFEMILANIMRSLDLRGEVQQIDALDQLRALQVPVHPKIAEALGVGWAVPERTYRFRNEDLTWEQYVRRYIACYG